MRTILVLGLILLALTFAITCSGAEVRIGWQHPDIEGSTFKVWRGIELLATVEAIAEATVQLPTDQQSAITVTATNYAGRTSAHSLPLVAMPVTSQSSEDLKTWTTEKRSVFFAVLESNGVKIPKQFFRHQYNPTQ